MSAEVMAAVLCTKCGHSVWDHARHIREGGCDHCECERTTYDSLVKR